MIFVMVNYNVEAILNLDNVGLDCCVRFRFNYLYYLCLSIDSA